MRAPLLLTLLAGCWCARAAPSTLQLVHVLYRHGARTPINPYPTDPNRGAWPQGEGQLTNEGKRNQLELGRYLRRRYDGFLPAAYHLNYTCVELTDVDRTLMSAQVNLAGLYPPQGADVWDAQLAWQPIPVHTRPVQTDFKLKSYDCCAAYQRERERVFDSPEMAALVARNAALFAYLGEHSGKDVTDLEKLSYLYDTLWIEAHHNLTTPDWALAPPPGATAPAFPDLMKPLNDIEFGVFGATPLLRRLGGGPLLKEMLENMQARVDGTLQPPSRRMFVYSAHDVNVACVLTTLQVYNGLAPPLSSCLLVELHSDPDAGPLVQLFYRNDSSTEPHQLQLPGCDVSCPWSEFVRLTKNVVPDDVAGECKDEGHVGNGRGRRKA
ncbi:testicular acid phosphatase homolog [Pollicipes pollicipes]|uniref:testicular acid phosphatase homolog n=1 Tax=Pollicipes pollicipes TaxID=41117 RepID=UPI001885716F|nr:testicular acid phosphatase homolog [Pollicipes pollicipes]